MKGYYLGIDMGSVSTNLVLMNPDKSIAHKIYIRSQGRPVDSLKEGMQQLSQQAGDFEVLGAGVTGSGRKLIGALVGADVVKNEITAVDVLMLVALILVGVAVVAFIILLLSGKKKKKKGEQQNEKNNS